jgi:DNA-directed RNA polymerase subunit F|tara:strand:+ start:2278 stop:2616 length:339 start_codon:yes stop_codon:yes gene_type:complete
MIGKNVIKERVITIAEAKKLLKDSMKEEEEPIYEKKIALDYFNKVSKLNAKKSRKLVEDLIKSDDKIREVTAVKIVDLMPKDEEDVRAIFAKERYVLEKENIENILDKIKGK